MRIRKCRLNKNSKGVFKISIVKEPAIEEDFVKLSKQPSPVVAIDRQILVGAVLVPDKMIYRRDPDTEEEYYITFDADTIREAAYKFMIDQHSNDISTNHKLDCGDDASVVESWIIEDETYDKSRAYGLTDLPVGTWCVIVKVSDPDLWNTIKDSPLSGFSIEGTFEFSKQSPDEDSIFDEIVKILNSTKNEA